MCLRVVVVFSLVFRFVCDFWIIYVIDKCYGASIFFFWSVPSFLWLLLCIIFLKWSFLWFTTWWWMLPSSNVHMMCAHFCIQVNWHLTEIIGNQWFWLRRRLLCCFFVFVFVVRTLRFELQQQWKLHRRQDIGEKWHQPIALNSIGGGAWTAYKIKPEFNRWVLHLLLLLSPFSRRVIFTRWISDTAFTNST